MEKIVIIELTDSQYSELLIAIGVVSHLTVPNNFIDHLMSNLSETTISTLAFINKDINKVIDIIKTNKKSDEKEERK